MPTRIEHIPFAFNLAINQGVILNETAALGGIIKEIKIHWPNGCNALVDVRVGHSTVQLCPREGFLALNDATPTFPFDERVYEGETLWVEMRNTDGGFPHNITVTITVQGQEEGKV